MILNHPMRNKLKIHTVGLYLKILKFLTLYSKYKKQSNNTLEVHTQLIPFI